MNRVAVLSREKTGVSRRWGSKLDDRGKKMADRYLDQMTLKVGHVCVQGR